MSTAYQRRWRSAGNDVREITKSTFEPYTCGTSWDSVRWRKPLGESGGRTSRLTSSFEAASISKNSYLSTPSQKLLSDRRSNQNQFGDDRRFGALTERISRIEGISSGISSRYDRHLSSDRFQKSTMSQQQPKPSTYGNYVSKFDKNKNVLDSKNYYISSRRQTSLQDRRRSPTPSRSYETTSRSKYSTSVLFSDEKNNYLPTQSSTSIIKKAERPWRQRMADAARLRSVHGENIGDVFATLAASRARRSSISSNHNGDELQSSLNALRSFVDNTNVGSLSRRNSRFALNDLPKSDSFNRNVLYWKQFGESCDSINNNRQSTDRKIYAKMSRSYSPVRPSYLPSYRTSASREISPAVHSFAGLYKAPRDSILPIRTLSSWHSEAQQRKAECNQRRSQLRTKVHDNVKDSDSSSGAEERAKSRERRLLKRFKKKQSTPEEQPDEELLKKNAIRGGRARKSKIKKNTESDNVLSDESLISDSNLPTNEIAIPLSIRANNQNKTLSTEKLLFDINKRKIVKSLAASKSVLKCKKEVIQRRKQYLPETNIKDVLSNCNRNDSLIDANDRIIMKKKQDKTKGLSKMVHKVIPITKKGAECKKILSTRMMPKSIQKVEDDLNRAIELAQSLLDKRGKNISNSPTSDSVQNIPHRNRSDVENSNEISPLTPNFVKYSSSSSEQKMETVSSVGSKQIEKDEDYAAIARFIPGKSKKSSAPVPGLWAHPESHEVNISHNKHIDCEIPASFHEATAILKEFASLTLPPFWIVACTKGNIVDINISALFRVIDWSEKAAAIASTRRKYAVARRIKEPIQRSKVEICLPLTLNFSFNLSYEFLSNEKVSKTWILKPKALETCVANLIVPSDCKISVLRRIMKDEKGSSGGAEVIVLSSPIEGKNFYKCTRKFRAIRPQSKEKSITTSKTIKQPIENLSNELSDQKKDSYKSESFASVVLQNLRKERDASNRNNFPIDYHHRSDTLSLAARVLEEYIRNKKGDEIIRLHSEPPIIEEDDSRDSPCLSTTSELVPPCAVRVVKPDRSFPYITTPARNKCNSEEAIIKEPSLSLNDMLTVGKQNPSASNFHAFKSKLQHSQPKPFVFDKPKTLFEERVQNQANMLRKTSATSTISSFSEDETNRKETTPVYDITLKLPSPNRARHSSVENISSSSVPITCNFTAAAAAASIPRHERYAAHIPVNRAESTGRVSTNSIDSNASGQLDVAERQLDQMIDQARMRHYQHRSRFKEAIDYLDQIFEDLNKENDQAENSTQASRFPTTAKNKKLVDPHINNDFNSSSKPTVSTKAPQCAPSYISPNSRAQNGVHSTFHSSLPSKTKQREVKNLNGLESAVEVSETITVGRSKLKNERMDYTKKWLADDIKSWASVSSKPDLLLGGIEDDADSDERSVGSCSAEVAAINSLDRQKKFKNTPDLLKGLRISDKHARRNADRNLKQNAIKTSHTVPIKPQPLRPQPLNFSTSSTSLNSIFNNFPSSHRDIDKSNRNGNNTNGRECGTSLKRVSSHSQVIDKKYNHESSPWNSLSQDPFHAVGSIASDGSPFRTTAFAQYHPQRSFNEPIKEPSPVKTIRNDINPDPLLAMDALVAELDLNTDEMHPSGKRRSFPINVEAKKAKNLGLIKSPKKNSFPTKAPENPSDQKSKSKRECPNKSFDEMANMLHNVAGEINFTSSRKLEKNGNLQKSSQVMSPFDTINNEKINPSKVEALQSIFEKKIDAPSWRKKGRSNREEEHYHEISAFNLKESSSTKAKNVSLSPTRVNTMSRKIPTSQHDSIPAIPHIQASTVLAGSTNSSQTGGYYSSGSSLGAQSSCANSYNQSSLPRSPGRRGSYLGKHSHAASIDDEDDGFYDNLQIDERRFSRSSDMDNTSILSSRLPPNSKSSNRLGQFLRKIASSKPPENAASLVSLNKVPGETLIKQIPLMKSNSLSNEPWRKRVFNEKHPAHSGTLEKRTGFGQRLKNSIFGSKKRLA